MTLQAVRLFRYFGKGLSMATLGTAFASDFDGTLCQSDWVTGEQHFDPANLDAIRRYQADGGL